MRFDEIDLFGDFKINGATGTSGKVLGMTNGTIGWITVTSDGGGGALGAQGATGPSPTQDVQSTSIGIGNGSSLCQVSYLSFSKTNQTLNILSPGTILDLNNCNIGLISSKYGSIGNSSCRSTAISSYKPGLYGAQNSSIFSSFNNPSGVGGIGASCNSIIGSSCNISEYNGICSSSNSVILSSCIVINGSLLNSQNSSIISSSYGRMGGSGTSKNNIILASCGGVMSGTASENAIIASCDNNNSTTINSCQSVVIGTERAELENSRSSAIIGGALNSICGSTQSVILGGQNLTLNNKSNTTMVPNLIVSKIKFLPSPTSVPPNLTDGQIWYRNDKLYVRFAGSTGTFSLVT